MASKDRSTAGDTTDLLKNIENMLTDKLQPITARLTSIEQSLTELQNDVARISTIEKKLSKTGKRDPNLEN